MLKDSWRVSRRLFGTHQVLFLSLFLSCSKKKGMIYGLLLELNKCYGILHTGVDTETLLMVESASTSFSYILNKFEGSRNGVQPIWENGWRILDWSNHQESIGTGPLDLYRRNWIGLIEWALIEPDQRIVKNP